MSDETEDYTPEKIREYLRRWPELVASAEGGTGSLNGNGAGRGDRLGLVAMVADLEYAADRLPPEWAATRAVFRMQERAAPPYAGALVGVDDRPLDAAVRRMAATLGWEPSPAPTP